MRAAKELERRAAVYAALGDPVRLAIIDELAMSDRSPTELRLLIGIESNLLAHHLDVLDAAGLIERSRSSGDGRRRYVRFVPSTLEGVRSTSRITVDEAMFVCTANSARSQLAAALWRKITAGTATCAGTRPAERVHPEAIAAGRRAGLDLTDARPRALLPGERMPALVIAVCDNAYEEAADASSWWHWSIPDPAPVGTPAAFDRTVHELRNRIESLVDHPGLAS